MQNHERGNIILIVVGVAMALLLIGFFRSEKSFFGTVNFKAALNLPCGLTIQQPDKKKKDESVSFPLTVSGYIHGCGWEKSGNLAGMAQVFDDLGSPVTGPVALVIPKDSTEDPFYFEATLSLQSAPHTGEGTILIHSTTGLGEAVPIKF